MFKNIPAKLSSLLFLAVFFLPLSTLHAQATTSDPQTDVVTGTSPDALSSLILSQMYSTNDDTGDDVVGTSPEPTGEPKVDGGDPTTSDDPNGPGNMLQSIAVGAFVTFRLS